MFDGNARRSCSSRRVVLGVNSATAAENMRSVEGGSGLLSVRSTALPWRRRWPDTADPPTSASPAVAQRSEQRKEHLSHLRVRRRGRAVAQLIRITLQLVELAPVPVAIRVRVSGEHVPRRPHRGEPPALERRPLEQDVSLSPAGRVTGKPQERDAIHPLATG